MNLHRPALAAVLGLGLVLAGCGNDGSSDDSSQAQTLTVFAAASLKSTFTELAKDFEADHAGVTVKLSFAGSSDLAAQITEGAPADVFAAADERTMGIVTDAGDATGTPEIFATNTMQIAAPADNPAGIESLKDLTASDVTLVICAPQVPCGAAAQGVFANAGIKVTPASEEQSVTDVLGKVTSGEADAGLVYVTDVKGAGDQVTGIEIPADDNVVNTYPITALAGAADDDLAASFVDFVTGDQGQKVLQDAGFGAP